MSVHEEHIEHGRRETVEISQPILGLKPYVLIELESYDEEENKLDISVDLGGGLTQADLPDVLGLVQAELLSQ